MKHLFSIAVLVLATCGRALGDPASVEGELAQLVNDINVAVVKADVAFLERVLHPDYVHHGQRGTVENRAQYLENRKTGRVDFESLLADEIKVGVYGDTAVVTYRSAAKGKDQQGAIDGQRFFTRVFLRRDGRWQQVQSQATPTQLAVARPADEARRANPQDPAGDERVLTQLVKDLNGAVIKADIAFLERVLHPDYVHHGPRGLAENRAQYLENRKTGRVEYKALEWDEIKVRLYGDTAVVTGRSTAKGKDQHGEFDDQRFFTRVFLRREGRWQLVHSQATPIQLAVARPVEEAQRARPQDPAGDERELTQLVKDLNGALVKADVAFLERVLHQDYVHHRPSGTIENRAQYLENRKTGRVDFESLFSDEIKIRLHGDTAVATGRSTAKGKDQQGEIDGQRLWTRVFLRRDGRWQLVHFQGTPIQKA